MSQLFLQKTSQNTLNEGPFHCFVFLNHLWSREKLVACPAGLIRVSEALCEPVCCVNRCVHRLYRCATTVSTYPSLFLSFQARKPENNKHCFIKITNRTVVNSHLQNSNPSFYSPLITKYLPGKYMLHNRLALHNLTLPGETDNITNNILSDVPFV